MNTVLYRSARTLVLAIFFASTLSYAQPDPAASDGGFFDWFDWISKGLHKVGERTQELIRPDFTPVGEINDFSDLVTHTREFERNWPVNPKTVVTVINEFGEIHISAWENNVVQVTATITGGAETPDLARDLASRINIDVAEEPEQVTIRTIYPDTRAMGRVAKEVNYEIKLPRGNSVICDNFFGDTIVEGVGGNLTLNAKYGVVDLQNITGPVRVNALGEMPLLASGLREGGIFTLSRTQAEFKNVAKTLHVQNFMGAVEVHDMASDSSVEIVNDSGPVHLYVAENTQPHIEALALFGAVHSDIRLEQGVSGDLSYGRLFNIESSQRAILQTSFGEIFVHQEGTPAEGTPLPAVGSEYFDRVLPESLTIGENSDVVVDAIAGNIQVTGVDGDTLSVRAKQLVQVADMEQAGPALDLLDFRVVSTDNRIRIETRATGDLAGAGCSYYRIDLEITCPRRIPIEIRGASGQTRVTGMNASVKSVQQEGAVTVDDTMGALDLSNARGGITVRNAQGQVIAAVQHGRVDTLKVAGWQQITGQDGTVLIDEPQGPVTVKHTGGDVRIIALQGILGAYDISVERGDLSMVVPDSADAAFDVHVVGGTVHSRSKLHGSIGSGEQNLEGVLNGGAYMVKLEAREGNIYID